MKYCSSNAIPEPLLCKYKDHIPKMLLNIIEYIYKHIFLLFHLRASLSKNAFREFCMTENNPCIKLYPRHLLPNLDQENHFCFSHFLKVWYFNRNVITRIPFIISAVGYKYINKPKWVQCHHNLGLLKNYKKKYFTFSL